MHDSVSDDIIGHIGTCASRIKITSRASPGTNSVPRLSDGRSLIHRYPRSGRDAVIAIRSARGDRAAIYIRRRVPYGGGTCVTYHWTRAIRRLLSTLMISILHDRHAIRRPPPIARKCPIITRRSTRDIERSIPLLFPIYDDAIQRKSLKRTPRSNYQHSDKTLLLNQGLRKVSRDFFFHAHYSLMEIKFCPCLKLDLPVLCKHSNVL